MAKYRFDCCSISWHRIPCRLEIGRNHSFGIWAELPFEQVEEMHSNDTRTIALMSKVRVEKKQWKKGANCRRNECVIKKI